MESLQKTYNLKNIFSLFLLLISIIVTTACTHKTSVDKTSLDDTVEIDMQKPSEDNTLPQLPEGNFDQDENGNFFGDIYVRGYATTVTIPEAFCETDCLMYEYVFFHSLETSSRDALNMFEKGSEGNSFIGIQRIGIGCHQDGIISYENDSDETGMKAYTIPVDQTDTILKSTEQDPIVLRLNRKLYTSGRGAPTCYSHFSEIETL